MDDSVTAAVAVIAVLLWHNPQLFVVASCQGWVRDSPLSCVGCGTYTLKGSKFSTCQSHSCYDLNASLSLQLNQLKICSMRGKKKKDNNPNQPTKDLITKSTSISFQMKTVRIMLCFQNFLLVIHLILSN